MHRTRRTPPSPLPRDRATRAAAFWTRTTVAVAAAALLVLGGGGAAWAWWAISGSLNGSASAVQLLPPTGLGCTESGLLNIRLSWTAPVQTLPAGATRQYVVVAVGAGGATTEVSAADTTTVRTIAPGAITQDGTTTLAVQTRVVLPGTTWTSAVSNTVGVDRNWLFLYYLECA
ncbi:hypothetical protein [Cellulomonas sp. Leaf334]|uniref:hypothetical protein n=1 Tax=Cellulomonas sp. Leaf334 TaxID=1736339 RepID=UPI000701EE61|nr:hypothetical protein [Cellulomonas sp. Leaf334]KQR17037.1 hypothetical protein ASF78_06870 [Cellulomonas sp. Leaf334]